MEGQCVTGEIPGVFSSLKRDEILLVYVYVGKRGQLRVDVKSR